MKKSTHRPRRTRTRRSKRSTDAFSQKKMGKETPFFEIGKISGINKNGLALSGKGQPGKAVNFGNGANVKLKGLTEADYSNNTWKATKEKLGKGKNCENCEGKKCVKYTGVLVSSFKVSTKVNLPSMADYQDYKPCQRKKIKAAIDNILAPHEQEHVKAFKKYDGTVKTPYTILSCRDKLKEVAGEKLQEIHNNVEAPRRKNAQDTSDLLDPFVVHVDLKCK